MRSGILGGTFDPIHFGHLRTAEEIGEELELEKVYLIPSASPPHKKGDPVSPFFHRLAMTRMAVGESSRLEVLDLEGRRPGPSYSVETLRELREGYADHDFFFIIGVDAFLEIETWKEYRQLFEYTHFVIIERNSFQLNDLEPLLRKLDLRPRKTDTPGELLLPNAKRILFRSTTRMDISSSRVRRMVSEDKSIRFLVPDCVKHYIEREKLYRETWKF